MSFAKFLTHDILPRPEVGLFSFYPPLYLFFIDYLFLNLRVIF